MLLELTGISKRFGATQALAGVDFAVDKGRVHALVGENGAGKSTLMKILSGALRPDEGEIRIDGQPVTMRNPAEGRARGIAMVYQELTLAPHLTVAQNLELGIEQSRLGFVRPRREAMKEALAMLGHPGLPLDAPVRSLGIGLRQIVEIARGLMTQARVVIMDEPTSSLSAADTERLFDAVERLRKSNIAVIYISHFLEEVQRISDDWTVLRDGQTVGTGTMEGTTQADLIRLMVGRTLNEMFPRVPHTQGDGLMQVLSLRGGPVQNVSFTLHRGEILGIAGLVGAGRSETVRRIFGLDRPAAGGISLPSGRDKRLADVNPRTMLDEGFGLLSENRKDEGLAVEMSIGDNVTLSSLRGFAGLRGWGFLNLARERQAASEWIERLGVKCRGPRQKVSGLSGGNQQKVALARILQDGSDVVLLDEPTRGIDVGSKIEIYRLMGELAARGKAVVFVSSYLPELLGVCDTLGVMHRGRLSPIRPVGEWNEETVMAVAASGESLS